MFSRLSTTLVSFSILVALAPVKSAPTLFMARQDSYGDASNGTSTSAATAGAPDFVKQNGLDAQKLNVQFSTMKATDACQLGQMACISGGFAQCVAGKWEVTPCATGLTCVALPLVNKAGTSLVCDTNTDALSRFEAAGVSGGLTGSDTTSSSGTGGNSEPDNASGDGEDCADDDGDEGDDEDLPFCDDDDAFSSSASSIPTSTVPSTLPSISITASPVPTIANQADNGGSTIFLNTMTSDAAPSETPATIIKLNRRQIPSTLATLPAATISPTLSTSAIATPTVVIGTDGIVTVTIVSTVTVPATDCAATIATPIPTVISVSSAIPPLSSASSTNTFPLLPSTTSAGLPNLTTPTLTLSSSTSFTQLLPVQPAVTSSAINNNAGGISFPSFTPDSPVVTPVATSTFDFSGALTATIGPQ